MIPQGNGKPHPGTEAAEFLVTIRPAGGTGERVLAQLEQGADRLATVLEKGDRPQKTYSWTINRQGDRAQNQTNERYRD